MTPSPPHGASDTNGLGFRVANDAFGIELKLAAVDHFALQREPSATFGTAVLILEQSPDGGGYRGNGQTGVRANQSCGLAAGRYRSGDSGKDVSPVVAGILLAIVRQQHPRPVRG